MLADRLGRRQAFMLTLGLYSVASLAGAFSPDLWVLILTRFIAGIGIGAELPVADSYLADLLPVRARGRYVVWAYTLAFCGVPVVSLLGSNLVNRTVLGLDGWRWLFILGSLGAVVVWILRRNLPESPRWLESVGRRDEAAKIVASFEREAAAAGPLPPPQADVDAAATSSLRWLFRAPLLRRTTMMLIFQPLQSIGYYGFGTLAPLVLAAKGYSVVSSLVFAALSYFGYPLGSLMALPLIERFERKWLIVGAGTAMTVFGFGYALAAAPWLIVVFGFLYTAVSNIFSNAYHVYHTELFPTNVRASAAGFCFSLSRLSTAAMPFVLVPVLHAYGVGWVFTITGAAMAVVVVTIGTLGPVTNGRALEMIADDRPDGEVSR
jgi:putative MFS transporter